MDLEVVKQKPGTQSLANLERYMRRRSLATRSTVCIAAIRQSPRNEEGTEVQHSQPHMVPANHIRRPNSTSPSYLGLGDEKFLKE